MPVFLDYYSQIDRSSVQQIEERTRLLHGHFDVDLLDMVGFGAVDAMEMADWIAEEVGGQVISAVNRHSADIRRGTFEPWTEREDPLSFDRRKMTAAFGEKKAEAFWRLFVSSRGSADLTYLTDTNPAEKRPLFQNGPHTALCPSANALYMAIESQLTDALITSPLKQRFLKRRDNTLEKRVENAFRTYTGPGAHYWAGIYETPHAQFEHDLVIKLDRDLLVIESKASPPRAPLRDPEKAFVRIKDDFRS
jgi:hypothetical protein